MTIDQKNVKKTNPKRTKNEQKTKKTEPKRIKTSKIPQFFRRRVNTGKKSMLDKSSILLYKLINKELTKSSSGRSSVVEHQLPKLVGRFLHLISPYFNSTYVSSFCLITTILQKLNTIGTQ
jgi:hypothetical protein